MTYLGIYSEPSAAAIRAFINNEPLYKLHPDWHMRSNDSVGAWLDKDVWIDYSVLDNETQRLVYNELRDHWPLAEAVRRLAAGAATRDDRGWIKISSLQLREGLVELGWLDGVD